MGAQRKTFKLASFSGGIDLREGQFAEQQNRFRDLVNYRVGNAKKLIRRPPLVKSAGTLDANTQGLVELHGALYAIAKKGDAVTVTTTPAPTVLRFDNPDYCTSWSLIDAKVFNGVVVALIAHTFPAAATPTLVRLHVFDNKPDVPTYVEDPYCPSNFVGGILSSSTTRTYVATWSPSMTVAKGHLWISGPDGNTFFSKTSNARAWNQLELTDLTDSGQEWAWVTTDTPGVQTFILSEQYSILQFGLGADGKLTLIRLTAYLVEYQDATGSWVPMVEDAFVLAPSVDKHWTPRSQVSRFDATKTEIAVKIYWAGAGGVPIRFRAIMKSRTAVVSGISPYTATHNVTPDRMDLTMSAGVISIDQDGVVTQHPVAAYTGSSFTNEDGGYVLIDDTGYTNGTKTVNSTVSLVQDFGALASVAAPTGYQRWHNHIAFAFDYSASASNAYPVELDTVWQNTRLIALAFYAGATDAGFLPTASQPVASSQITALASSKDRLLVFYSSGVELWGLGLAASDHQMIDSGPVGTGVQAIPVPANVLSTVMIANSRGIRSVSLDGYNLELLRDQNVGEPIVDLGPPTQLAAAYWPYLGEYVTAVTIGGVFQFLVFDYSPESKVAAWSRWTTAGLSAVNARQLVPLDARLYARAGTDLYYFDATAAAFRDSNDAAGVGNAYESKAVWHFNDMQRPGLPKQVFNADLVQIGTSSIAFQTVPQDSSQETDAVPVVDTTYATGGIPVSAWGPGIAPVLRSTDETGHELQELSLGFIIRDR